MPGMLDRSATSPYPLTKRSLSSCYLVPVGLVKFRPDGAIEMANPVAAQLLMPLAPASDMSNLYRVLSPAVPDLQQRIAAFQGPSGSICDQLQVTVPPTRTVLTLNINKIDPGTLMATVQDITRAIERETRIREDQQRFRVIFENVRDHAIYTVDADGRIDTWNGTLARIGGWSPEDVLGAPLGIFFPEDPIHQAQSVSLLDRASQFGTAEVESWRVRKDGSRYWGNTIAACLPDQDGRANGYVLVTHDLTERKQMEDRLVVLSTTDPLTGARNRRAGETKLEEVFREWRRNQRLFTVLMIDCDNFKVINDTWGHNAGDQVLIALVRICQDKLRDVDNSFRWGGEEFMIILAESKDVSARTVAERLRSALEIAEIGYDGHQIKVTVSIGIAEVRATDGSADDVVNRADRALYAAKNAGRNRVIAG